MLNEKRRRATRLCHSGIVRESCWSKLNWCSSGTFVIVVSYQRVSDATVFFRRFYSKNSYCRNKLLSCLRCAFMSLQRQKSCQYITRPYT
ncbi:hypothetical protein K435DRAFT_465972 [Dendrothele bispora CBS 962.96]|uniref:Uncharacterized protein n=1 Tax=Dendrothele bispora (strain CBS 962.96) TaxID=1314807 RepID=A0A4S8MC80_DENBC|nr:hypothetical protein K435DRAFT_465972 [Dendrothele bispora CBS 962.96]